MPYYPEDQSSDNLKAITQTNICQVCNERLDMFIDPESHKVFIACKDYLRTKHEGIGRAYKPSLIEETNYEGGIRRMVQVEQEHGPEKARVLAKYQATTSLTQKDAMEIMETIWPKAPLTDKKAAAILCSSYNLNPLMNHVFLIKFNKRKDGKIVGEEWVRVLGIKAKRLISSRQGAIMYLDMSPRIMTEQEQITVWGKVDDNNVCFITHLKDAQSGAEAYGFGKWPKNEEPYGTDKGNSKENMAGIRSESQGLDRLRPGEMPIGVAVMDEQYLDKEGTKQQYEVTIEKEPELGDTPPEALSGIDMDWLNETLKEMKWTEETTKSFLAKYKVSTEGTLVEVIARLNREQAEDFTKTLQTKVGGL